MRYFEKFLTSVRELMATHWLQYLIFLSISLGVAVCTEIIHFSNSLSFQLYFGEISPLLLVGTIVLLGVVLFTSLLWRGWFLIFRKNNRKRLLYVYGLAVLLALIMIGVDIIVVMPADMNILFPESLLFYPAIGFLVEILFHVLPLTLLLFILEILFKKLSINRSVWLSIILVAFLEPTYQTIYGSSGHLPTWSVVYIWLHVFLINLSQLIIFKRYDFITMYFFRLVYYLLWHIIWGKMRLELLF